MYLIRIVGDIGGGGVHGFYEASEQAVVFLVIYPKGG